MPDEPQTLGNIEPIEIQEEMERSFLDYAMSVITVAGAARRARRLEAGAPPHPLRDVRRGHAARPPAPQVRERGRRSDGQVPPARRPVDLRRARPHGAGLLAALPADRRARQLRLADPTTGRPRPATPKRGCRRSRWSCSARSTRTPSTSATTYDGRNREPLVLPARFPNLLVNGGGGIAVGMATNIPPHNLREVIDATLHLIDNPDATVDDLMQFVHGSRLPDRRADPRPGRHRRVLPHRSRLDPHARDRRDRRGRATAGSASSCRELPYQTSVEAIGAEDRRARERPPHRGHPRRHATSRRATRSASSSTSSATRTRRSCSTSSTSTRRCRRTSRRTCWRSSTACRALLNLRTALEVYVAHQVEVITRRSRVPARARPRDRAHILEGLLKALDMIDAIITLIRGSESADAAKPGAACSRRSSSARCRPRTSSTCRCAGSPRSSARSCATSTTSSRQTIAELEAILADDGEAARRSSRTSSPRSATSTATSAAREITTDYGDLADLDLIEDEELVVVLSHKGYVKTVAGRPVPRAGPRRQGRARRRTSATRTTSSTCSRRPRTRTCCSSRTAAASTACARTRSR